MADAQAVKKPAGGAFGQYLNANRATLSERAAKEGLKGVAAVSKLASQAWKELSEADKAPWEAKFKEAQAAFEAYKNSDGYVKPEKKEKKGKKGKEGKKIKDKEAPKKPVGGAYGVFSNEKRAEFTKAVEAKGEKGFGPVAKMTSEAFKALSEAERKVYADKFEALVKQYKVDIAAYKEKKGAEEPAVAEESPAKNQKKEKAKKGSPKQKAASPKKRGRAPSATAAKADAETPPKKEAPAAKRGRGAAKAKAKEGPPSVQLPADVLATAEKEKLRAALENLARRPEIVELKCAPPKMLEALRSAGGLVNKAKAALLGGA